MQTGTRTRSTMTSRIRSDNWEGAGLRCLATGLALMWWSGVAWAQVTLDPQFAAGIQQARLPPVVQTEFEPAVAALGTTVTYRVAVVANAEGVSVPETPPTPVGLGLRYVGKGYAHTVAGTNQVLTCLLFNYRVTVSSTGTYVMPPYQVSANGRFVEAPAARLRVVASGDPAAQSAPRFYAELGAPNAYVGQMIPVRGVLVDPPEGTAVGTGAMQVLGDAIIVENATLRLRREPRPVETGMRMATVAEMFITPVKEGRHPITVLLQPVARRLPTQGINLPNVNTLLDADPIELIARHLPREGQLPGFTGAVGELRVDTTQLSTNRVQLGEPVVLSVTIRGAEALLRLVPPRPPTVRDWQVMEPSSDGASPLANLHRGFALFHYTLIPLSPETRATPELPFSAFSPVRNAYVDLTVPAVPITVRPAPDAKASPLAAAPVPPAAPGETEDGLVLPGLADSPGWRTPTLTPLQQRPWFLALQFLPALGLAWLWVRERQRQLREAFPEIELRARARRGMTRALRRWRQARRAGDVTASVRAAAEALRHYASSARGGKAEALVGQDVIASLPSDCAAADQAAAVRELFALADGMRFREIPPHPDRVGALALALEPLMQRLHRSLGRGTTWWWRGRGRRPQGLRAGAAPAAGLGRGLAALMLGSALLLADAANPAPGLIATTATSSPPRTSSRAPFRAEQPEPAPPHDAGAAWFDTGRAAYAAGRFEEAAAAFRRATHAAWSPGALHNLGNAEWRLGNPGEAILAWERALWLSPRSRDARASLRYARSVKRLQGPELTWYEVCSTWLPAAVWAWLAALSFWGAAAMAFLPGLRRWRKPETSQAVAAAGFALWILTLPALAGVHTRSSLAVVRPTEAALRLTPTREGQTVTRLRGGEVVRVLKNRGEYRRVRLGNDASGWLHRSEIGIVSGPSDEP